MKRFISVCFVFTLALAAFPATSEAQLFRKLFGPKEAPRKPVRRPKCKSRRVFPIRVFYRGKEMLKVTVTVDGKKQRVLRMRPRPKIRVDLRGLPRRTVKVKITIRAADGSTIRRERTFHTCAKKHVPPKPAPKPKKPKNT